MWPKTKSVKVGTDNEKVRPSSQTVWPKIGPSYFVFAALALYIQCFRCIEFKKWSSFGRDILFYNRRRESGQTIQNSSAFVYYHDYFRHFL